MTDYILKAEPAVAVLTPYALARSAHHMYEMARAYDGGGDASLIRLYACCVAIELGLKAAILGEDCTPAKKIELKKIGHDLVELNVKFDMTFPNQTLFEAADVDALAAINSFFKQKGLEYFTLPVLESGERRRRHA